ncbi:MAG: hypothetical protein K0S47_2784 [Herbinix sp.]|jgi:hypothetical protein|nr:hypothetical protein [Herbinix sp.]
MDYKDIDKLLKYALSPVNHPSDQQNDKIIHQFKESGVMKMRNKSLKLAVCVLFCILFLPTSVYAAYKYLLPKEAAVRMEDEQLGEHFDKDGEEVLQTITDGPYKVTYLGHVTGEDISERTGTAWELHPDRIYVAVAIQRKDGIEISYNDNLFVSPLIQGLQPWSYNIATMNGSYMEKNIEGVLYRIIECDNVEIFADKELYLAVSDTTFYSVDAFQYDDTTGIITEKDDYTGTNILFKLDLDPTKADQEKANAYLKQLEVEWNGDSNSDDNHNEDLINDSDIDLDNNQDYSTKKDQDINQETNQETDQEKDQEKNQDINIGNNQTNDPVNTESAQDINEVNKESNPRVQKEIFTDQENGLTFHITENESSRWWAKDTKSETVFRYTLKVIGEGIEYLSYTLNKGEFCYYPVNAPDEIEFFGNEIQIPYDDQETGYNYSIIFGAKYQDYGYDMEELNNLGYTDIDARDKIYYDVLNQEIEATKISMEIKMKDGRNIEKTLTLQNVLNQEIGSIWITITVE